MVNNNYGVRASRRAGVLAALLFVSIVATIVVPGVIQPAPAAPLLQECRPLSSLNIQGEILSAATAIIPQTGPWRIRLTLNTSRHTMLCDSDFYCTTQGIDKCAFRPPLSFNISAIEVVSGTSPFPTCQLVWDITPINRLADVGFGFKIKYQEDVVGSGGSGINPKRKSATLTVHPPPANYVYGTEFDVLDTLVEQADDGS